MNSGNGQLVRLEGIEPPYNALEERCVIHYATDGYLVINKL